MWAYLQLAGWLADKVIELENRQARRQAPVIKMSAADAKWLSDALASECEAPGACICADCCLAEYQRRHPDPVIE